jgi:serine/threonine protein phosphatase PrpC
MTCMPAAGYDQVAKTHVGCRRKLNEDAVLACPDRRLWVVADGMGGHDAGDVASAMVVEALWRSPSDGGGGATVDGVLAALNEVNERLVEMGRTGFDSRTIGSTVVGLVANGDALTCFWAGDSRAYQVRDGRIDRLSRDHSLVQDLIDAGMITEREAESHPNANIITRAVGAADQLRVDTAAVDVRSDDLFLLASDGLTRLVSDQELLSALQGGDIEASAVELLELALNRDAPDNVSLIIVRAIDAPAHSRTILHHGLQWQ